MNETFAQKIKTLRLLHAERQIDMAGNIGTSPTAISYWERGIHAPSRAYQKAIIEFYRLPNNYFKNSVRTP